MKTKVTFYLILPSLLLLFVSAYLSKNYLLNFYVQYSFKKYCREALHWDLNFDTYSCSEEGWILKNISATQSNTHEKVFFVEELKLKYSLDLFSFNQHFTVFFNRPKISLKNLFSGSKKKNIRNRSSYKKIILFKTKIDLEVSEAELFLKEFQGNPLFVLNMTGGANSTLSLMGECWDFSNKKRITHFQLNNVDDRHTYHMVCEDLGLQLIGSDLIPEPLSQVVKDHAVIKMDLKISKDNASMRLFFKPNDVFDMHLGFEMTKEGVAIKEGHFFTSTFPIENYLSFLTKKDLQLSANARLSGTFNQENVVIYYMLENIKIQHPLGIFAVSHLNNPGVYYVDLQTGDHGGALQFDQGSLSTLSPSLSLQNIRAFLSISKTGLFCPSLEFFCNGAYWEGDCFTKNSSCFNLTTKKMKASIDQVKDILKRVSPDNPLIAIPLKGELSSRQEEMLTIGIDKALKIHCQGFLKGELKEGHVTLSLLDQSLSNVTSHFDYDMGAEELIFWNPYASLNHLSENFDHEFYLAGDYIKLRDFKNLKGEFDLWMGNKNSDILRLTGSAYQDDSLFNIHLNPEKSHLGEIFPKELNFTLKEGRLLENFRCVAAFDCRSIYNTYEILKKLLLPQSTFFDSLIQKTKSLSGPLDLSLQYDRVEDKCICFLTGTECSLQKVKFKKMGIHAVKRDKCWKINECFFDDLSLAAEFEQLKDSWKVNFLGARLAERSMLGMEGIFNPLKQIFKGKINFLELDIEQLKRFPFFKKISREMDLNGCLYGTGEMHLLLLNDSMKVQCNCSASLKNWSINGIHFKNSKPFHFLFLPERKLKIENLNAVCLNPEAGRLHLNRFEWDLSNGEMNVDKLNFILSKQNLPLLFDPFLTIKKLLTFISPLENFVGVLSYQGNAKIGLTQMQLKEGDYSCFNKMLHCKELWLNSDTKEMKISTEIVLPDQPCSISVMGSLAMHDGINEAILHEEGPDHLGESIKIRWSEKQGNTLIEKIEGKCAGIETTLQASPSGRSLIGTTSIDMDKMKPWVSQKWVKVMENLNLHGDLQLRGEWNIGMGNHPDKPPFLAFNGSVEGHQLKLSHFMIESLKGELNADSLNPEGMTATGMFRIGYLSKKERADFISNENLSKYHLHPDILYPVEGEVSYRIDDLKLLLTDLQNVYSLGKLSKFTLSKDLPSYLDFDGNLCLQVSMKQSGLLYKAANQFLLSIQGQVQHPDIKLINKN